MSLSVKIEPLNKDNFDTWKIQVEALLIKNDAWKYVSGKCVKPNSPNDSILEWESADAKAKSDLILSVSTTELKQIKNCKTSKDVWNKLHEIYQSKGPARKAMLLKSLILLKMKNGEDIREHIHKFFDIVDKIKEMDMEIIDELLSILLLYSIPEEYEPFRIAIETQENLPDPEILKVKLLEEYEARRRNINEESTDAMFAKKNNKKRFGSNGFHTNKEEKFKYACNFCGKRGHMAKDCWIKDKKNGRKNESSRNAEVAMQINGERDSWCLDSGASSHMCADKLKFNSLKSPGAKVLHLANSNSTEIKGSGIVKLRTNTGFTAKLEDTLYVPDLRSNLLSVAKITDHGFEIKFNKKEAVIMNNKTGEKLMVAKRNKNLYYVQEEVENCRAAQPSNLKEWHERYGHLNENDLKDIIRKEKVNGIDFNVNEKLEFCEACVKGKQSQKPFTRSNTKSTEVLELVHTDVCGPMRVNSIGGSRYFLTFIDDKSRWCEIYFLKKKNEVFEKFKEFKSMVEKSTGHKIKALRSDNGTEYTNNEFKNFLKKEGIKNQFTVEYTPQQNGVAERKNRTLVEMARCLMIQSGLSPSFWAEAILTANHIRNRCPSQSLDGETPFKIWIGRNPTVNYFQKFGTTAYMLEKSNKRGKFDPKSKMCIFIGYSTKSKAYRLWDPKGRKIVCSRDVKFSNSYQPDGKYADFLKNELTKKDDDANIEVTFTQKKTSEQTEFQETLIPQDEPNSEDSLDELEEFEGFQESEEENRNQNVEENLNEQLTPLTTKHGPGRPRKLKTGKRGRPRKLFNTLQDNGTESNESGRNIDENIIQCASLVDHNDTLTPLEAISSPEGEQWKNAMKSEYDALMKNNTWTLVDYPKNHKVVDSRWILRKKYKADGTVERYKARVVAKGFTQTPGVDFGETFSPVARIGSIRLLMAMAVELNLNVYQLDFVTAYLNGEIEEKIYMKTPTEIQKILDINEHELYEGKVCLLQKALYGLKQSGRQWYKKLDEKLKQLNLSPLKSDPCIYMLKQGGKVILVAIYVDDLIIATNNEEKWIELKSELSKSFEMKDLGQLNFCLGIEFRQDPITKEITMSQRKYIQNILKKFNMENSKPVTTPLNSSIKLSKEMCPKTETEKAEAEKLPYQNLVGSLMYLAVSTRPDIAHAVSVLSQYNTNYGKEHWVAAKRVLRYLRSTESIGLHYKKSDQKLTGFADADWGANLDDRRSYTGYIFKLSNAAISWDSRKQRTVAMSSTEAEYMSLSESCKEAIHLRRFLSEIMGPQNTTTIYNDNQGAGLLSKNPIFHNRTKHMDIRHHFVRENVMDGIIKIEYMTTNEMPADFLTKGLSTPKHDKCISKVGLLNIHN